ncbi:HNH endonuclease [Corynebacterium pseudopelargi]
MCQIQGDGCTGTATQVDHIVPYAEGGRETLANLQAVCHTCHAAKSALEANRGRARQSKYRPAPGRPGSRNRRKTSDSFGWDCPTW